MSDLPTVEDGDPGKPTPVLEAEPFEQRDARGVVLEENGEQHVDSAIRRPPHRLLDETRRDTPASVLLVDVVADLGRVPNRATPGPVVAQTDPPTDRVSGGGDEDRVAVGFMIPEP